MNQFTHQITGLGTVRIVILRLTRKKVQRSFQPVIPTAVVQNGNIEAGLTLTIHFVCTCIRNHAMIVLHIIIPASFGPVCRTKLRNSRKTRFTITTLSVDNGTPHIIVLIPQNRWESITHKESINQRLANSQSAATAHTTGCCQKWNSPICPVGTGK